MANDNKKINELVDDDEDPTAELEALTVRMADAEADANTFDIPDDGNDDSDNLSIAQLRADLRTRSDTIERLQFDIEQLHSKWLGLEAEIKAREEMTGKLNAELKSTERKLARKEKLLQQRDRSIKSLKAEIRERDKRFRELENFVNDVETEIKELEAGDEINAARRQLAEQAGQLASGDNELRDLRAQQVRTEQYADELRRQLTDLVNNRDDAHAERDRLSVALAAAEDAIEDLTTRLDDATNQAAENAENLQEAQRAHEQEIRTLRFELGEAEETLAQNETISEQLASDLVETRNYRDELERMLTETEKQSTNNVEELEKKVAKYEKMIAEYEDKLETKSNAINCLLTELAKKSSEIESIGEMEDVIQEIDDRISERIDERPAERDRVTRLMVGRIDDQELRFPLFKDRVTIGRTGQNDIQIKAQYISRRHAVVVTEGDATRIIDWGSKNGVFVSGRRVTEHFLKNGDIVAIGAAEFRYEERPKRDG